MIDLSSNENPYEPPRSVVEAVIKSSGDLRRYVGSEELQKLKSSIADYAGTSSRRIILGAGTDFLTSAIVIAFSKGRSIVTFNPSFSRAVESARYSAEKILKIQLKPFVGRLDPGEFLKGPSLVVFDSPNNPTGGMLVDEESLLQILKDKGNIALVDEACYEFSGETFSGHVETNPNLVVARTLDKAFSLAGLRVSYLIAGDAILERMGCAGQTINRPACMAAIAALRERDRAAENVKAVIAERERLKRGLERLGMHVAESRGNFLLAGSDVPELSLALREKGIAICDLSSSWMGRFYRISVGAKWQNDLLVDKISEIEKDYKSKISY